MANEATIRSSLSILNSKLDYSSRPTSFQVDVSGEKGPTPGAIEVSIAGTDIDLSELTTPGLCRVMNLDDVDYIIYGIWDGTTFHELGEIGPGETYIVKLFRSIGSGIGTGYANLRLACGAGGSATVDAVVEAFER